MSQGSPALSLSGKGWKSEKVNLKDTHFGPEYRRSDNVLRSASVPSSLACTIRGWDGLIQVWSRSTEKAEILADYDPGSRPFDEAVDGLNKVLLAVLIMQT